MKKFSVANVREYMSVAAFGQRSSKRLRKESRKVAQSKYENSSTNKWLVFHVKASLVEAWGLPALPLLRHEAEYAGQSLHGPWKIEARSVLGVNTLLKA